MNFNLIMFIAIVWKAKWSHQVDLVVVTEEKFNRPIVKRAASSDPPKIKEFIVKTNVANRFAETHVLSKVENTEQYSKQATFSVVLPESAFISGFFMEINGTKYKAFVLEKEEAKKIYSNSLSSGQTAAHVAVSTRNSNRFTINVNVEPESKVSFHLTYEELLQREKGLYEIIANIQPGQVVKKLEVQVNITENRPLLFVTTPSLRSGNAVVQNSVNLDPHAKIKISNTSAIVTFRPDISRQLEFACAGLGNKEYDGFAGQFIVQYDIERDPQGAETLFQDEFFINFFAPPKLEPLPAHFVFLLDKSGSMSGVKISHLKEAMATILSLLHPDDLFDIIPYESNVYVRDENSGYVNVIPRYPEYGNLAAHLQTLTIPESFRATQQNIEMAKNTVAAMSADGGTNAIGGLEVGLYLIKLIGEKHNGKYQPILIFMTDGLPNEGISDTNEIIKKVESINSREYRTLIYSVCIGNDADWGFLQTLSLATGAVPTRIHVDDVTNSDVSTQLEAFYDTIRTPVLKEVKFNNLPKSTQTTKVYYPIFFNGSEITIAGKGASSNVSKPITISAKGKDGPLELEAKIGIPLTRLERVWAYLTVKQLIQDFYATGSQNNKTQLSKLVLDIALNYSLVTDMTSLVVAKPNDTSNAVNLQDASKGVFPEAPNELPMCSNVTNWIITNFGTPEPTTWEPTTLQPTTLEITTIEPTTVYTGFIGESEVGAARPTTPEPTTERIKTCKESTFGCCHDGVSFAVGLNFSGCDPVPKSESCALPQDIGTCSDFTMKWWYDPKMGECREFWYGGCDGNGNRFKSKEICESVCVKPTGLDRCKLPIFLGKCGKFTLSWFYDQKKDECVKFLYSGCGGNTNRFDSKYECMKLCVSPSKRTSLQDACSLQKVVGTCRRFEMRYYYDIKKGTCLKFWYSGCGANDNNFKTEADCKKVCINPDGQDICKLPHVRGPCSKSIQRWYFDNDQKTCKQFKYGGCKANKNNFATREECYNSCLIGSNVNLQEACFLKEDTGPCTSYTPKWVYNRKEGRCNQFWYGGCEGNNNRFETEKSCKQICVNPLGKDRCKLPRVRGPCTQNQTRWYYDKNKKKCKTFSYGGCFGNANNFISIDDCNKVCM